MEWGYGGMGSVSGSDNSKYSVLATGSPALLSHSQNQKAIIGGGRGGAAKVAVERIAEDDDGSGMGWVRKRREERERLAKEKEAQESRAIAEARRSGEMTRSSLDNTVASALDTDSRRTSTDGSSALDTDLSTLAASSAPTTPPSTTDTLPFTGVTSEEEEQHILHAVRLSPKHTHHHHPHHRLPSAQGHSPGNQDLVVGTTIGTLEPDKNSPMSESSSDADEEEETPKEDDDDDSSIEQTEVRLPYNIPHTTLTHVTRFRISARRPLVLEWRRSAGTKKYCTKTATVERAIATCGGSGYLPT